MKRKVLSIFMFFVLTFSLVIPAFAAGLSVTYTGSAIQGCSMTFTTTANGIYTGTSTVCDYFCVTRPDGSTDVLGNQNGTVWNNMGSNVFMFSCAYTFTQLGQYRITAYYSDGGWSLYSSTYNINVIELPTPTYSVPTYHCYWGTKLSDLTFVDSCFLWSSNTSDTLPLGTLTRYATYTKSGYKTVTNIPITIVVTAYPVHFQMTVK